MADTLRIKRRAAGGAAGAPATLVAAEIAYNEQDDVLYYGWGNSGGTATAVKPIAGPGAFAPLNSPAFTGSPTAPTPTVGDSDTSVATTAFVAAAIAAGGGGGGGAAVLVSDTAPVAADNSLWWESDTGALFIRFNDLSGTQWAQINGGQGPVGPAGPAADTSALAPLASPAFTGTPTAPLPAVGTDSTQIATTEWVRDQYLQNSVVFVVPSQATGVVGVIQTLTVTGAAVGDYCLASFSLDLNGMTLLAWVSATNTIKFQFQNKTAGTLNLGSGTVRVRVWKQ